MPRNVIAKNSKLVFGQGLPLPEILRKNVLLFNISRKIHLVMQFPIDLTTQICTLPKYCRRFHLGQSHPHTVRILFYLFHLWLMCPTGTTELNWNGLKTIWEEMRGRLQTTSAWWGWGSCTPAAPQEASEHIPHLWPQKGMKQRSFLFSHLLLSESPETKPRRWRARPLWGVGLLLGPRGSGRAALRSAYLQKRNKKTHPRHYFFKERR